MPRSNIITTLELPPGVAPVEDWPHRPVFVYADPRDNFRVKDSKITDPCPIGEVFHFESDLFVGKGLIRVRGLGSSNNPENDAAYFHSKKRLAQFIIQGKFKQEFESSDLVSGAEFSKPLKRHVPSIINKLILAVLRRVSPGVKCNFNSENPYVLTSFAESAQVVHISKEGEEPDITLPTGVKESGFAKSQSERRKLFRQGPSQGPTRKIRTDRVYTFERYDDMVDYTTLNVNFKFMTVDLASEINGQPIPIMVKSIKEDKHLWNFQIYHERQVERKDSENLS